MNQYQRQHHANGNYIAAVAGVITQMPTCHIYCCNWAFFFRKSSFKIDTSLIFEHPSCLIDTITI